MEDVLLDLLELITILLTMAGTSFDKLMSPRIIEYIMQEPPPWDPTETKPFKQNTYSLWNLDPRALHPWKLDPYP